MVLRAGAVGLVLPLVLVASTGCLRRARVEAPTVVVVEGAFGDPAVSSADSGEHAAGVGDSGSFQPKDEVEVEWHGSWWPAVLVERRGGDRWLVHYGGYDTDWDEIVGSDRIRERRAELQSEEGEEIEDEPDP